MESRASRLARGIASDYILFSATTLVGLFLTPLILASIGPVYFGLWVMVGSLVRYTRLLGFGFGPATTRFIAFHRSRDSGTGARAVFGTSLVIHSGLAALVLVVGVLASRFLPDLLDLNHELVATGQSIFLVVCAALVLTMLTLPFQSLVFGHQQLPVVNAVRILGVLANAVIVYYLLQNRAGAMGLAIAELITALLIGGLMLVYVRRNFFGIISALKSWDRQLLRSLLVFNLYIFLAALATRLIYTTDNIVIGAIKGVAAVAAYAVVFRLITMGRSLIRFSTRALIPVYPELHAAGNVKRSASTYLESSRLSIGIGLLLFLLMAIFGRDFIVAWVGSEHTASASIILVLGFVLLLEAVVNPGRVMLMGVEKHRQASFTLIGEGLLNLLFSLLLIRSLGLLGVALATVVARSLTSLWIFPWLSCRVTKLSWPGYFRAVILPAILVGLVATAPVIALRQLWVEDSLLVIGAFAALLAILYGIAYWFIAAGDSQKRLVKNFALETMNALQKNRQGLA